MIQVTTPSPDLCSPGPNRPTFQTNSDIQTHSASTIHIRIQISQAGTSTQRPGAFENKANGTTLELHASTIAMSQILTSRQAEEL